MQEVTQRVARCPRCGTALEPDWNVCPHCGWVVRPVAVQDEDATIPVGKHFSRDERGISQVAVPMGHREEPTCHDLPAQKDTFREGAHSEEGATAAVSGEETRRVLRREEAERTRVLDGEDRTRVKGGGPSESGFHKRDLNPRASREGFQARDVPGCSPDEKTRLLRDRPHTVPGGKAMPPDGESDAHVSVHDKTRLREVPRTSTVESPNVARAGGTAREDTARDERSESRRRRYAADGMRWRVRTTLRRVVDRLVGPNIDNTDDNGRDRSDYRPEGGHRHRPPQWPERLGMPKLAGLVGGVVCLFLLLSPWLSAVAVQGSGGLASVATLGPRSIVANTWDIIARTYGGTDGSRALSAFMEELAGEVAGTASGSILPAFVLLVLGVVRVVTLALLVAGLLLALFGSSCARFSTLCQGIKWTLWSSLAWVVVLPRLGWGVGSVSASSSATASVPSWGTGLVMGYAAGRNAWIAVVVSLVTLLVIRAWRRSHLDYWG